LPPYPPTRLLFKQWCETREVILGRVFFLHNRDLYAEIAAHLLDQRQISREILAGIFESAFETLAFPSGSLQGYRHR
jgi:hypothetical protein